MLKSNLFILFKHRYMLYVINLNKLACTIHFIFVVEKSNSWDIKIMKNLTLIIKFSCTKMFQTTKGMYTLITLPLSDPPDQLNLKSYLGISLSYLQKSIVLGTHQMKNNTGVKLDRKKQSILLTMFERVDLILTIL